MNEQPLSEHESLRLITEMIGKAKKNIHETGTSAILWGSVIAVCGLTSFAQIHWRFRLPFDIWMLTLIALLPQIWISIRESRTRAVQTHVQEAMNAVWLVYGISIFALVFYCNTVPGQAQRQLMESGIELLQRDPVNGPQAFRMFVPSYGSLLLLLYAIPTMVTGIAQRFKPMLIGAIICYGLFIASCFSINKYDYLFNGLAGITNWLIPGILLRRRYLKEKHSLNV